MNFNNKDSLSKIVNLKIINSIITKESQIRMIYLICDLKQNYFIIQALVFYLFLINSFTNK